MKKRKNILLLFSLLFLISSCNILDEEEPSFSCDKNSTIKINNKEHCSFAKSKVKAGRLEIGFGYSTGSLDLLINEKDIKVNTTYQYAKGEVSIWFNNLNKVNSGLFLITKLDEQNRLMSGHFDFNAESNNNSQAFNYVVSAKFTDVAY
ncbi:hypothetical protein [uncultured Polaribacter sp.]|uniref:hypothetical protein n=1 Tax=uncultured Polaribacter sp. TaxID=174711 RepID=UPI00261AE3CB|nr:hypothetical protein [uncultured Polaribacter sp.]